MSSSFLSICIPTYNRSELLVKLLSDLAREICELSIDYKIRVRVFDNASTDRTEEILKEHSNSYTWFGYTRNDTNVGAGNNVLKCINEDGDYLWIIGDDERIGVGVLRPLYRFLSEKSPDLVYLRNKWSLDPLPRRNAEDCSFEHCTASRFSTVTGMHITFISAMVVNKGFFLGEKFEAFERWNDTLFPHQAWILKLLKTSKKLYVSDEVAVYAKSGNSGGYEVCDIFGVQLPKIWRVELAQDHNELYLIFMKQLAYTFIMQWIWRAAFDEEKLFVKGSQQTISIIRESLKVFVFTRPFFFLVDCQQKLLSKIYYAVCKRVF